MFILPAEQPAFHTRMPACGSQFQVHIPASRKAGSESQWIAVQLLVVCFLEADRVSAF